MKSKALRVTGKLRFTPANPPKPFGVYVLQKTAPGLGNIPGDKTKSMQLRRHVPQANPRTLTQMLRRAIFRDAILAWRALSADEKVAARKRGKSRRIPGYGQFLREYLLTNTSAAITAWDAGATTWDAGETQWDFTTRTAWDAGATTWDAGATMWDAT
jgi:hypothetical protein